MTQTMMVTASATAFDWLIITPFGLEGGNSEDQKWPVHPRPLLLIGLFSLLWDVREGKVHDQKWRVQHRPLLLIGYS